VHQGAGLARYSERLAATLRQTLADEVELHPFYNRHSGNALPQSLEGLPATTAPLSQLPWRLSVLLSQVTRTPYPFLQNAIDNVAARGRTPILHATEHLLPRVTVPTVITVHDLIFERYPEHHTRRNVAFLRAALPRFVQAATAVIAVSQHTKDDLVSLYGVNPAKVHVIYEGVEEGFAPASEAEVRRVRGVYSPDRPWLLMVGTLEPRKNHVAALHALRRLKDQGFPHRLLVVGGEGWLFEPIARVVSDLNLVSDVSFTGYVPSADLPPLYTGADCTLLPSLYEGFGFPVLEAMACGSAVVCSDAASLPEVAGEAALLVKPVDFEGLANAVGLVLTQPALSDWMRRAGRRQASGFRWERCAVETSELYQEVALSSRAK
jgi:glycosyltransferase involved in cell wall biosynthesis